MVTVSMHYYGFLYLLFCNYLGLYGHCGLFGLCMTYYVDCNVRCAWMIKCLEYILMSLFVTVDAPKTRETLMNFSRETLIILHFYKGTNVVHILTINLLEHV